MNKIGLIFVLAIMLSMGMMNAVGINQDYPSKVVMKTGESAVYGIRIANPSDVCIGVKVIDTSKDAISSILNKQSIYYVMPKSTQKIFLNISIPQDGAKNSYSIQHSFTEVAQANNATVVDISLGAKSSITITVGNESTMQKHPQGEIDATLKEAPTICNLAAEGVKAQAQYVNKTETKAAEDAAALKASKENQSIIDSIAQAITPAKPIPVAGSLSISEAPQDDNELLYAAAIIFGFAVVGAVGITMAFKKKKAKLAEEKNRTTQMGNTTEKYR